ncbi:uncharacterized protein B0H64DRAFT_457362 [Chaetomium fimeti]|uniref:Uncharacterized protein n=1 Tax=Chaetomium fimeti TaxID=1854472 RepID=A0AAE0HIP0_9PEZI|nr:hypothetical protein B0H64DRAFT_457362 [Chaetomium fimeti]
MAELPPNPDRMLIPQHDPKLILSAETSFSMPDLPRSTDIYAEDFHLDRDLVLENKSDDPESKASLGSFVRSLSATVPEGRELLKIDLGGAKGTEAAANALSGGQVSCFIQRLDQRYVDTFNIDVYGGHAHDQVLNPDKVTPASPPAGGNGGTGGHVSVAFGSFVSSPLKLARKLISGVHQKPEAYPAGSADLLTQLTRRCEPKEVQAITGVPEALKTLKRYPKIDKKDFLQALIELVTVFASIEVHMESRVTQSIGVKGGTRGVGLENQSDNGKPGADGNAAVTLVSNPKAPWELSMCFAHPTQCNMVLERAKARYYAGTPRPGSDGKGKASLLAWGEARATLENLLDRLEFLDDAHRPTDLSKSNLVAAYKIGNATLSIPVSDTGTDDLPASLSQLITTRNEAVGLYAQMETGLDAFNDSYNSVPLGSFGSYEENLKSSLTYLRETELRFKGYKEAVDKAVENKEHIEASRRATNAAIAHNVNMHRDIVGELNKTAANIAQFDYPLSRARTSLTEAANQVKRELEKAIPFPFEELVNAGTQLLFVAKWPMAVLQGVNLVHHMATKIIKDDGTAVERQYLVRRVSNITGSIKSLKEGYKMLSNGKVHDEDRDASKLLVQEKELSDLMEDVNNSLSVETVRRVKTLFKFYITLVVQRSHDIMRYNALASTLVRYRTESQSLQQQRDRLQRANVATIDVHHPAIVVYMQKLYLKAIRTTEYWLYKAQRAYNYAALNDDNIIGDVLGDDPPFSRFDSTLLSEAHKSLSEAYQKYYLDKLGPARGDFHKRTVDLDPTQHIEVIRDSGKNSCTFFVEVVPGKAFDGMANVRLLRARCYLDGAKVSPSNKLHLTLTHAGMETLVDEVKKKHEFKHKAQILTAFKCHLETKEVELASTIGQGREESGYALVGPFVTWRVDVNKEYNTGLDLSNVTGGRLEFDGHYRPIR